MRVLSAFFLSVILGSTGMAAECTLANARYKQPDAPWWLTFKRVPQIAPANQTAAFYIEMPNSDVVLEGGVSVPNGFGAPLWSISGPCAADSTEQCTFLVDTDHPSIYGIYEGKVRFLDIERGGKAPEQVILPQLAVSLWYSNYRSTEWDGDVSPGDAFELLDCQ